MSFKFNRRLNLGSGIGINLGKKSGSVSVRTSHGSIGTKGVSFKTGIKGLNYRANWSNPFSVVILFALLAFKVLWLCVYLFWLFVYFGAIAAFAGLKICIWLVLTLFDLIQYLINRKTDSAK